VIASRKVPGPLSASEVTMTAEALPAIAKMASTTPAENRNAVTVDLSRMVFSLCIN